MVTIIIPTANRPTMLRAALRSVSAQTARGAIGLVMVSENGGRRESGQVCAEFPELPIRYVFREQSVTPVEHARILLSDSHQAKYTAILHDDDWWAPHHLELALKELEGRSHAAAYYASIFEVTGEASILRCDHNLFFWFGAGYPPLTSAWELSRSQVVLACLLMTPGRYSALVARTESLRNANVVHTLGNPFDTDRMLTLQLSKEGSVVYNPVPQVFIRAHELQDGSTFASEMRDEHAARTTEWIVQTAGERPVDLARRFVKAVKSCPPGARSLLDSYLRSPWCVPRMAPHPEMEPELGALSPVVDAPRAYDRMKHVLKQLIPPAVLSAKRMVVERALRS